MFWEGILIIAVLVFFFVATERYVWHAPRYEFIFWLVITTLFTCVLLLSEDSPLYYLLTLNIGPIGMTIFLGVFVPMVASFALESSRAAALNSVPSAAGDQVNEPVNPSARVKKQTVDSLLDNLVYSSQTRWLVAWLRGAVEERQERVHNILTEANAEELNHIFSNVNIPKLFTYANYTLESFKGQDSTIQYIMEERVNDLGTLPRAALLHSLMKMGALMFHSKQMEWACELLCSAKGDDLTVMKNYLDSGGDYNNLYKLIYQDVTDLDLRKKMLEHIKREGEKVRRMNDEEGLGGLKVLSDVDDTLYSSGGSWPAGCDTRFPHHAVYPGCLSLYEELDMNQRTPDAQQDRIVRVNHVRQNTKFQRKKTRSSLPIEDELEDQFEFDMADVTQTKRSFKGRRNSAKELALVAVDLPYEEGGGQVQMRVSQTDTIRAIQDKVQAQWRLPPWKQRLVITATRGVQAKQTTGLERSKGGNLVFLSARPHAYKDILENGSYRKFKVLYQQGRMHTTPTLLAGSLKSGIRAVLIHSYERAKIKMEELFDFWTAVCWATYSFVMDTYFDKKNVERRKSIRRMSIIDEVGNEIPMDKHERIENMSRLEKFMSRIDTQNSSKIKREVTTKNWEAVARTKAKSFRRYARLYPEYDFVFFGDNGQGDVMASELVAGNAELKNRLKCCFMHEVQAHEKTLSTHGDDREARWKKSEIVHFQTYVGAAVIAYEKELIPARALHRVGVCAHEELMDLILERPSFPKWGLAIKKLNKDIKKANVYLKEASSHRQFHLVIPAMMELDEILQ